MAEIKKMDDQTTEMVKDVLASSIYGNCYDFALALYRNIDCELVGVDDNGDIVHTGVLLPDGRIFDGRGEVSPDEFIKPFKGNGRKIVTDITEEKLLASGTVTDDKMEFYLCKAQLVWPELPWKAKTMHSRIMDFLTELEALCEKHGVWIRSSLPTAKPVICERYGDETFAAEPCVDGINYLLDRVIS